MPWVVAVNQYGNQLWHPFFWNIIVALATLMVYIQLWDNENQLVCYWVIHTENVLRQMDALAE